jgi:amino acid transporter
VFGWHLNDSLGSADQKLVALLTLVLITVLNIYGVKLVAIVNNTGVIFEILGMVVFAVILAVAHNNQGVGVITNSGSATVTVPFFLVGMFMSLYVIYGFDTASTLAEETRDPRAEAPKAVIGSVAGAFVIGAIFLWGVLIAVPNMNEAVKNFLGPAQIIDSVLSSALSTTYLLVVSAAIFVCCMAILTSTIRLCFGMARDDQLPGSRWMARVNPRVHTPIWSCIVVGALAAIPFIQFAGAAVIAVGATASIYFSYLLGNLAVMRARAKGWPRSRAPFSLGRWGMLVNVLAIAWGLAMLVNFLWPAGDSGANALRIFSNPSPNQTDYYGTGPLVHFFGFLNDIALIEQVIVIVFILGAIYYFGWQRKKPFQPVRPPQQENLEGIVQV